MILGATKQVDTISGRKTNVTIPAGTPSNKKIKIPS
jgi:DnaJ-class molecular chaperone